MQNRFQARAIEAITGFTALAALTLYLTIGSLHVLYAAGGKGNPKTGKVIFDKNCIGCHGKRGEGLGAMSNMPNFTDSKAMTARTDKELFDKITKGGKATGMPAWESLLGEQDRWNLVAYIRTLSAPASK